MPHNLIQQEFIHFKEIDSTNDFALAAIKENKLQSGTVILADFQSKGKGQRGKEWQAAPKSSLILSIIADLNEWQIKNIISLNHIVALGLQEFLKNYVADVKIKWPNDIMVNNKKITGILIENILSSTIRKSVIGFGINLNQEEVGAARATSLYLETGQKFHSVDLIYEVTACLTNWIHKYQAEGEEGLFNYYNQNLWKLNQSHNFKFDNDAFQGKIIQTTMEGQLEVEFTEGTQLFSNGEVRY